MTLSLLIIAADIFSPYFSGSLDSGSHLPFYTDDMNVNRVHYHAGKTLQTVFYRRLKATRDRRDIQAETENHVHIDVNAVVFSNDFDSPAETVLFKDVGTGIRKIAWNLVDNAVTVHCQATGNASYRVVSNSNISVTVRSV